MQLQESGEMYLETIFVLSKTMTAVRAIDVGEHLGFSKPSVSRAIGLLRQGGLVEVDALGHLALTEDGRAVAERTYERHRLLKEYFISLGVDADIADADACKIEHHISDETIGALKAHLTQLKSNFKED